MNNAKRTKKAQIKMFETIAVLIVFMFLIGFGVTFYFMMSKAGAEKEAERAASLKVIQSIQKISSLPELDCIRVGVQTENCFDLIKVHALAKLLEGPEKIDEYYNILGNSKITISILFPLNETITLYSNPLENAGYSASIYPVMVYDPVTDSFLFAITEVNLYERR